MLSKGPARASRKGLFVLGFYFSYKQWLLLPASDFPRPPQPQPSPGPGGSVAGGSRAVVTG